MGGPKKSGENHDLAKALAHPMRVRILEVLSERVACPKDMSDMLKEPLGNVSYHTNVLREFGFIEEVRKEPRLGAVAHFYRTIPQAAPSARRFQEVPKSLRGNVAAESLGSFTAHAVAALEEGTFQRREGSILAWMPVVVDPKGWQDLLRIVKGAESRISRVAADCAQRFDEHTEQIPTAVTLSAFEISPESEG